jgi:hypothetical protein
MIEFGMTVDRADTNDIGTQIELIRARQGL